MSDSYYGRVNLTIKKHMLDAIDERIGMAGVFLNRQEFIVSAIRRQLQAEGRKTS